MREWSTSAAAALLVASASNAGQTQDLSVPDSDTIVIHDVDPQDYDHLDGMWWCRFLRSTNKVERMYYSVWRFDAGQSQLEVEWSPVHKLSIYSYAWDGHRLALRRYGSYDTQIHIGGALVIKDPALPSKGWTCHRQLTTRWPQDRLQYLDYRRYPWLATLAEDRREILEITGKTGAR